MQLTCTCKSLKLMRFPTTPCPETGLLDFWGLPSSNDLLECCTKWEKGEKKNLKIAKHDNVCVWCAATLKSSLGKTKVSVTHSISKWHCLTSSTRWRTYHGCSDVPNGSRKKNVHSRPSRRWKGPEQWRTENQRPRSNTCVLYNALCLTSER